MILELQDVHTFYGDSHVLHGVTFALEAGTVGALLGRNGMGKTTTIRSLIGFNAPREGRISFRGQEVTGLPPHRIARLGMGLVPQGRGVFPNLTVRENLQLAARPGNGAGWDLERVYELFPRLRERANNGGGKLSGGEQQMLAIARALMTNPELLLMDEPSEGLAPVIVRQVAEIIRDLKAQGLSILLVEQNVPMALGVADRVFVLSKGKVVYQGAPAELARDHAVQAEHLGVGM